MPTPTYRKHEVQFCSDVSKWADSLFEKTPELPFGSSDIESFGRGSQKRQDFRVYARREKGRGPLALCGEVKLPGSQQGRSPFDMSLVQDAFDKATAENCRYFFTWNVEHLALFDRSLWDAESMYERCIGEWKLDLELDGPDQLTRPEVAATIRDKFLPKFFADFGDIWLKRKRDLRPLPADFWVTVVESHLRGPMGPVRELRDYLDSESARSKAFDARLRSWMANEQQWNFNRNDPQSWRETVDRAARSMAYVLSNRILFYQAVRARKNLPELKLPHSANTPEKALGYLHESFQEAVHVTGDYEPVFFPDAQEWAAQIALSGVNSLEAWDRFIRAMDRFNFKEIPTDILGHTFQKLISPEERQKFGQYYTDENIVDVINAFCIRKGEAAVLDPACGSGTFLVRAYYRKWALDKRLSNQELLSGLYGCDINPFPAHLATLNLAARNISDEENYPRVVRKNFFTVGPGKTFCELPTAFRDRRGNREREAIELPPLDAVIGNPPYVRHEHIPKATEKGTIADQAKEQIYKTAERSWPNLRLSKQSDLHIYFWPVAAQFLKEDGWFGFLTSSSWLDVRYGFPLQRWLLLNFRIVAIIESVDEPWFKDARVKTAVTILQRCQDQDERDANLVRFVRLKRPLAEILGERDDESQRQKAAEKLRDLILKTKSDNSTDRLRIMVRRQADLWAEGLSIAQMFEKQKTAGSGGAEIEVQADEVELEPEETAEVTGEFEAEDLGALAVDYGGGKWGRFLRAPDFYFQLLQEFGSRFTRLGDVASIKYGIKSGCDDFFMPRNASAEFLSKIQSETEWRTLPLMRRCSRGEVESGKTIVVRCGDGTLHPVESEYMRSEVHNLMRVDGPIVLPTELNRVVLWVDKELKDLKGTHVWNYITWGSKQAFSSEKSKTIPIPLRATISGRQRWYDITSADPGIGFWPEGQQYRHLIPANPYGVVCNHKLFEIHPLTGRSTTIQALIPVLNSTLIAFFKPFYGRYTGTEGNLQTSLIDTLLIEIPDPRNIAEELARRLESTLASMQKRKITHLVEEAFLKCHTADEVREAAKLPLGLPNELQQPDRRQLDDAVFELLGVTDSRRREKLIDQLYREVAFHNRNIRIIEVQKMEQRRHGAGKDRTSQMELALDAWNELDPDWRTPLSEWLEGQTGRAKIVNLPAGEARLTAAGDFFDPNTIYFGNKPAVSHVCAHRAEAELLYLVAREGLRGPVSLPATEAECKSLARTLETRLAEARAKFDELAQVRAGTDKLREQVVDLLYRWFIHGRPA